MIDIMERIEKHKEHLEGFFSLDQILGIFAYGSMNYGLMTENSDVDTKVIIIPTIEDLILRQEVSKEYHIDDEHAEAKDLRNMTLMWKKQNINFLEILFNEPDKTCWINPKYKDLWNKYFITNAERICRYNSRYGINSICGQAIHGLKGELTGKRLCNGFRLKYFLSKYSAGAPYKECLMPDQKTIDLCLEYKTGKRKPDVHTQEALIEWFTKMKDMKYFDFSSVPIDIDFLLIKFMKEALEYEKIYYSLS